MRPADRQHAAGTETGSKGRQLPLLLPDPTGSLAGFRPGRLLPSALLALAWLLLPIRLLAAGEFDLPQLTALLSQMKAGEATFTEKRQVAMLDKPLESSGRLSFEVPDTFVRETLAPRQEKISVVGNRVTMSQGNRSRSVALDSVREVALVVEAIRGTLTGNRDVLERNFLPTVGGSPQRWTLELVPRDPALRDKVASVRLAGQQSLVREVQVTMADGDRSVMTIEPTGVSGVGVPTPASTLPPAPFASSPR